MKTYRSAQNMVHFRSAVTAIRGLALLLFVATTLRAVEVEPPASQRFAAISGAETPDFQRHVIPLLGRIGCNARACHGSFQGQGGFQLSLFGHDFDTDHQALMQVSSSTSRSRIDIESPEESLILQKPLLLTEHQGGARFTVGSWQHHLLLRWIESGAASTPRPRQLERLEVQPSQIVLAGDSDAVALRVVAVWEEGMREDVTCLCRFRTNDNSVVEVDADGHLRSTGHGDTHVIVFYDNGVASVPVMRRRPPATTAVEPATWGTGRIDEIVSAKLRNLGIIPSALCTDEEFLRRVSIDMTGTLPIPGEVEEFVNDPDPEKRTKKIEELLARPTFAAWWANKLCDFTGCNPNQQAELGQELAEQWYRWLYARLRENMPYDQITERIILATGRSPDQSYRDYAAEVSSYFRDESPADFTRRETMPHYWTRTSVSEPEQKAMSLAHSFLGVRLECAQCHKHPWDRWTQQDFQQFSALFENLHFGVRRDDLENYRQLAAQVGLSSRDEDGSPIRRDVLVHAQEGGVIPWRELFITTRKQPVELDLLRSRRLSLAADEDPRPAIMHWMRSPDNPWFARAFVNRVWAGYFHRGIVEPTDDLNPANPPSHPELLDWLSRGFIDSGFDIRWLHRQIVSSATYQRSWRPNATNRDDSRNFSRAIPRRIPAEVMYDALKQATAAEDQMDLVRQDLSRRAVGYLSMRMAGTYAMQVFGKPNRSVNCDCERSIAPSLLQAIFMQNDPLTRSRIHESPWIKAITDDEVAGRMLDVDQLIRKAWLRSLSRPPRQPEIERARRHFDETENAALAVEDLLWALINTAEFGLNH